MTTQELITNAILNKKSINFEYIKINKVKGLRMGDPHAIFIVTTLKGEKSIKVHIFQTDGVSDSKFESPLPDFRMFDILDIKNVKILEKSFSVNSKYNSLWDGYEDVVVKIK